jgi:hypothetical protein
MLLDKWQKTVAVFREDRQQNTCNEAKLSFLMGKS